MSTTTALASYTLSHASTGLNMYKEIGFRADMQGEYKSRFAPHMDSFR